MKKLYNEAPFQIIKKGSNDGGQFKGVDGKTYGVLACVIRWDSTAGAWAFINDAQHIPVNADSVTADTSKIILNYASLGAKKVCSLVVCPDETFASLGYFCGASVGTGVANISIYSEAQPNDVSGYVNYTGADWNVISDQGFLTLGTWDAANSRMSFTHSTVGTGAGNNIALTGSGPLFPKVYASPTLSGFSVQWYNGAGELQTTPNTDFKVYVNRGGTKARALVDPLSAAAKFAGSNFWIYGVFEL